MPKLKRLSQKDVISILLTQGFELSGQTGSHIKLKRFSAYGTEVLIVPNHKEIKLGTLKKIFNQASRYIPQDILRKEFYSE
ncbi:type II toxin-antitoxin system HicA family toxin [Candidatus Kaiserbacteria bacterium]|nr:MAG: type II toxin-antitoxin system HicA family toxin [Candidatus Kaiserbacteria bacterium]